MMPSTIFSTVNLAAMLMWILMIFLPKWKVTEFMIRLKIIPIVLGLIYMIFIIQSMLSGVVLDFGSLSSVKALFTNENMVLAGWMHYLAFDLLIGMWIIDQNKKIGLHIILMAPCLFLTFMLGPIGYLLFTFFKNIKKT